MPAPNKTSYLISIIGPTAIGKTRLSLRLAKKYQTEIISCDSRQMYRLIDIGTAKPTQVERKEVPHHFIDYLNPDELYTAGQFERDAEQLLTTLFKDKRVVIVVGGSTLYIRTLWEGIDDMPDIPTEVRQGLRKQYETTGLVPLLAELRQVDSETFNLIDQQNYMRVIRALEVYRASGKPISFFRNQKKAKTSDYVHIKIGLQLERTQLYARINQRVDEMLKNGFESEVKHLLSLGYLPTANALQSIGYREMLSYLEGTIDQAEAIRLIKRNSRRYAKRQFTFFRRFKDIQWFEAGADDEIEKWLASVIK